MPKSRQQLVQENRDLAARVAELEEYIQDSIDDASDILNPEDSEDDEEE